MEWFKLSSKLPRDPKWKVLSPRAKVAYIEMACEVAEQETDGLYVNAAKVPSPAEMELKNAGLIETRGADWYLPAFTKWNFTHAQMDAKRNAGRNASRIRWGNAEPNGKRNAKPNTEVEVERELEEDLKPLPEHRRAKYPEWFEQFWAVYPRRDGKRKAYLKAKDAIQRAPLEEILEGARRYRDDPNREAEFTAHPATWLYRDSWEDDPLPARTKQEPRRTALGQLASDLMKEVGNGSEESDEASRASLRGLPGKGH